MQGQEPSPASWLGDSSVVPRRIADLCVRWNRILRNDASRAGLVLAAIICLLFGDVIFGGHTLFPTPVVPGVMPNGAYGYQGRKPSSHFATDPAATLNAIMAYDRYTQNTLSAGELPLWNPLEGIGVPHDALFQSSLLSPLVWAEMLLPTRYWDYLLLLTLWLSGIWCYSYLRAVQRSHPGAVLGAVIWITSSWLIPFLAMRVIINTVAGFPLALYGIELVRRRDRSLRGVIVASLGLFLIITGGQPEIAVLALIVWALYAGYRAASAETGVRLSAILLSGLALVSATFVTSGHWLPFLEYFSSHAVTGRSGVVLEQLPGMWHQSVSYIIEWFTPLFFGPPHAWAAPGWNWPLFSGSFDLAVWFLAALSIVPIYRHHSAGGLFWGIVVLSSLSKFLGVPPINQILGSLPLLGQFHFTRYAAFIPLMGFAFLSALAADHLKETSVRLRSGTLVSLGLIVGVAFVLGLAELRRGGELAVVHQPFDLARLETPIGPIVVASIMATSLFVLWELSSQAKLRIEWFLGLIVIGAIIAFPRGLPFRPWLGTVGLVVAGMLAIWVASRMTLSKATAVVAGIVAAIALLNLSISMASPQGLPQRHDPFKAPPSIQSLRDNTRDGSRVYGMDGVLSAHSSIALGLASPAMLEALMPRRFDEYISDFLQPGANPFIFAWSTKSDDLVFNRRYWDLLDVKYILTTRSYPDVLTAGLHESDRSPVPLTSPQRQELEIPFQGPLSGIAVLMSTHDLSSSGEVVLDLYREGNETPVRTVRLPADGIKDNQLQLFQFASVPFEVGVRYSFSIRHEGARSGNEVAIWRQGHSQAEGVGDESEFGPIIAFPTTMRLVYDKEVKIFENPSAVPRVFLATNILWADSPDQALETLKSDTIDLARSAVLETPVADVVDTSVLRAQPSTAGGGLLEFTQTANMVRFKVDNPSPAIAVLTDLWYPGWAATVDGVEQPILRVDGLFRGVLLDPGVHDVLYTYTPTRLGPIVLLTLVGVAIPLTLGVIGAARARSRSRTRKTVTAEHTQA